MAATDLGKVGIVMKGTWSSSATYEVLDAVSYNGGLYIAKQAVPANTLPTNTTYWQMATDISSLADGIGFSYTNNNASNIIIKYLGNRNNFKLLGNFGVDGQILLYAGYPYASGGGTNLRGLWSIDVNGGIKELSSIGGTLPTVAINQEKTEMTITLPFTYGFIFIMTYRQYAFSLS